MEQNKKMVPELRFPEFGFLWKEDRIGERTVWKSGGTPSKEIGEYWKGTIPWISASSMHVDNLCFSELNITESAAIKGSRIAKENSLLILVRGSMLYNRIPVGIVTKRLAFNQDVKSVYADNSLNYRFLFYWFKYSEHKLLSMVVGTGIGAGKLEIDDLKSLTISFPDSLEQQKIAAFLTSVDQKIEKLTEKRDLLQQYKKGLMQKLFSQQLRFKQDDSSDFPDWEEKPLSELAERCTKKNDDDSIKRVLTNSAVHGILDQQEYFEKDIANANNLAGYYVVEEDDYVYNPRISVYAPVGPINKNKVGIGLMSPLYSIFRFKDTSTDFYEYFFQSTEWHRYMSTVANYGARHDRMNISTADFMGIPLPLPSVEEQKKITNALQVISDKVLAVQDHLEQVTNVKKALLQKMFV
ncbi:restriction endonuclease subunit S [Vibrio penaeicida]|uniref:restriction endonuclease subunit S n=1 Tax=Vibrio penaeicida TaxID=104609 RepID=UPI002736611B|nr:restriction endonuclease subunit S [Vibrio penaeicida]MDP2570791.1 restriction endonuclease subunit S [Vibrio penaeicida]